MLGTRQ